MLNRVLRWSWTALWRTLALLVALTIACQLVNWATEPPDTLAAPDGEDVQVNGMRVHYREWGTSGPALLLVHGYAEHTAVWGPVATRLASDHRVVAVDLAGFGYTEYTGRYALVDQVAMVDGLITALALDKPILVGHSLGAAVVSAVALDHPDHVGGVVLADGDALPFPGESSGPPSWVLKAPPFTTAYRIGTRWGWVGRSIIRNQCGTTCKDVAPDLPEAWLRPMRQGDAERAQQVMARSVILHLSPDQLRRITVPRAIIWGSEDARSGGSLDQTRVNLGHPDEVLIPGAGHLSMVSDADAFAAAVRQLTAAMH